MYGHKNKKYQKDEPKSNFSFEKSLNNFFQASLSEIKRKNSLIIFDYLQN